MKEAFVRLYEQGLIYRGAYIVNWDPAIQTAVSDLEVVHEERVGQAVSRSLSAGGWDGIDRDCDDAAGDDAGRRGGGGEPGGRAVHGAGGQDAAAAAERVDGGPEREIPVMADEWANPEFGTGAVKVTPAHDPNDFAIGQRHGLPQPDDPG